MAERKPGVREPLGEKIKDAVPLQNHWEDFVSWLLGKTELFAQKYRYTLTARLLNLALDIQEKIIRARFLPGSEKLAILESLHIDMEIMASFFRHCHHHRLFSAEAYEYASKKLVEATKMVAGWKKYEKGQHESAQV